MADIFAAIDLTTLATSVSAVLVLFVGVDLLFVANRSRKKAGIK